MQAWVSMTWLRVSVFVFLLVPFAHVAAQPTPPSDAAAATATASPPPAVVPVADAPATQPAAAPTGDAPTDDELGNSELGRTGLLSDEQVLYEERYGYADQPSRTSPHENPDTSYWSFGFSYRHAWVPARVVELFVGQAPRGIDIPSYQFEIDRRRNGTDVIMTLSYSDFSFVGPFRGRGDGLDETEMIHSSLRSVAASASMLWSSNFSDVFALQYGFDAGLGVMFGDVIRTEAYPSDGGPHTHDGYAPCVGPTAPGVGGSAQSADAFDSGRYAAPFDTVGSFCGAPNDTNPAGGYTDADGHKGEHYGVRAHNLLHGGSVPFFSWRLAPRLSLRIKPIRQIVMRFDVGFDLGSGVFLGAGLHYGF